VILWDSSEVEVWSSESRDHVIWCHSRFITSGVEFYVAKGSRFIEDNNLVDIPLHGRKFTWFKGDGLSMSRLDRFLLSEEWCLVWPNCK
jgi:hypothetical protein